MRLRAAAGALVVSAFTGSAAGQALEVPAELWDRPRAAADIAGQTSIKAAVLAALAQPESRLVIHHANAQEPLLQAEELRSWLGALAVDTRRIVLRSDLSLGAPLRLEVVP
jgi:hypothetical protein